MRQKRQMDKLRFLTESRNGKESVIEKLIHKDNSSSNRISCSIAEKSDIKSVMDICFARQQWMTEQGFNYVLNKDNRKYYRHKIEDRKLWVCKHSGVVMGFCVVEDHDINGYWKDFPTDSFVYAHDGMTRPHKSVKETSEYNFIGILINAIIDFYGKGIRFDVLLPNQRLESFYEKELGCNPVKKVIDEDDGSCHLLMEKTNNNPSLTESFTKKISSKKNTDLISEPSFVLDNGVYIFHKTLGVRTVDSWNPKDNKGVVGILLVEDDHKIVVALEDAPENLTWSKKRKLFNQPVDKLEDAESDFNGEYYCQKLDSPDFPAAYYCKTYNKGGRDWYLPSSGEQWLICRHLEEIQNALETVGGQKFVTTFWDKDVPVYWSSTEFSATNAWTLHLNSGFFDYWGDKVSDSRKVRPVSKFDFSTLKESFTRKIRSKKNDELTTKADTAFVPDGVYILHETLGVRTVDGWNPKDNEGVTGILLIEDDHKIVVATEDAPEELCWSKKRGLINQPVDELEDAESDFNGEYYCRKLDSPDFPAAYYCKTYNKGNRDWYLPSSGELWMIYHHRKEIQNALSIVGGQKFDTNWNEGFPLYWSSTEGDAIGAWTLSVDDEYLFGCHNKVSWRHKVRPVSKFDFSTLKESFTRKIRSKKNDELISKPSFELDNGVYILHETLGVCGVDNWDSENNDGVEGILVKDNDTKLIVSVDEFTEIWARKLQSKFNVNKTFIYRDSLNASDKKKYTGKILCQKLNSPDFPAAYRCLCYHKGNINNWYLPSIQELHTIAEHRHEIQEALIKVNGDILKFSGENVIILKSRSGQGGNWYWSSTEAHREEAWSYNFDMDRDSGWTRKSENSFQVRPVAYFGEDSGLEESFTRKISRKNNDELISKADTDIIPDGIYILHDTLGVKSVEGWNPKFNKGVVGVLVVEDEHQLVVALEDAPENLPWSNEYGLINQSVDELEDAESDFNGEMYCRKLDSPDFPAAYYCKTYNKGGRSWYLPSSGELWMIYRHLDEIQNALSIVGGVTIWDDDVPVYWSSTELSATDAWNLYLLDGYLSSWGDRVSDSGKVRPVSKFDFSTLKESFTRKISRKKNNELTIKADNAFIPDGIYILHETLGVKTVEEWNPKNNDGVVGVLLVEDDHKIVISLEDAPEELKWSDKETSSQCELINEPIKELEDAESDFNGEYYCRNLNSPDFPAVYYCLNYKKGGRKWHLPSSGELWLIYNHFEEIQNALKTVGGKKLVTTWIDNVPWYWSSTKYNATVAWGLYFNKYKKPLEWDVFFSRGKVRPVSNFNPSLLKESFTKKIKKSSNKDLVDIADKLASTTYDYNEVNFTRKLRKETEQYFKSEFYKVYHYPLDYRYNGDIWPADEDGFHNMYLKSTYYTERNEEVNFEGYFNDDTNNCAEPADVGVIVFGYGKDCVAYNEYGEYRKTHPLTESFTTKTKNKTVKDLQNKSDNVFNLDNLLREYVKSHCRPGSHNYDFYFAEENRPVFSDKEWKKLKGITVVKEIDDYYPSLHVVTPHGSTISNDFLPNVDDVFLFYIYRRRKFHIPVNRLPEKLLQELMEWILNINESFTRKTKQKSTEDIKQKADEYIGFKNLVKEIVLENDSFKENDKMSRIFRNRQPRCTHALNKLRVRPTSDPTLSPYAIQGMVVLDESFYFKPEKYNISSLLAKDLTRKAMKDLYNSDFIIVLNRIYTMEYRGKEFLRTEFHILRYNERYGRYSDEMNPQYVYFEFADLPKELQSDIYSFLRKRFNKK